MRFCPSLPAILIGHVLLAAGTPVGAQVVPRTVGDVTRDGKITAADALAVLVHVVGKTLPQGFSVDPDGDAACRGNVVGIHPQGNVHKLHHMGTSSITALDALSILARVVGKNPPDACVGFQDNPGYVPRFDVREAGGVTADSLETAVGITEWVQVHVEVPGTPTRPWNGFTPTPEHALAGLLRFSSDNPAVVRVDTLSEWTWSLARLVTGQAGVARIYAHWFDRTDTAVIVVHPWEPSRITTGMTQVPLKDGTIVQNQLVVGDSTWVGATAHDARANSHALKRDSVVWQSRSPTVASVDASGRVRSHVPGSAWVVGSWQGLSDSVQVTVISNTDATMAVVGSAYQRWFRANYAYNGPGLALSNAAFQHNAPWANVGMEVTSRLPRVPFVNSTADGSFQDLTSPWRATYAALDALAAAYRDLATPELQASLGPEAVERARAFVRFVQGLHHANVAVLFAQGFVVDENTNTTPPMVPVAYPHLMEAAFGYLDQAIALAQGASWSLPWEWMRTSLTGPDLARVAHSMKARYWVATARTRAERAAVNWHQVVAAVDAGVTADLVMSMDRNQGWPNEVLQYGTLSGWSQLAYFMYGMADQSGRYQTWNAAAMADKSYNVGGTDILLVTPDNRFPAGATVAEQRATPGRYFRINTPAESGGTWARPDRGTWRWSWYKHTRGEEYYASSAFDHPEIRMAEMRLLKAEGLIRMGNYAAASTIINETRVPSGLNATDAAGTNTSCVPKLPSNSCGDLFEMLKWEKRMENTFKGPFGNLWYFDARGWGDLWKGTFLHLPIPCDEATKHGLPCVTYGGSGDGAAALSTYKWNGEG